MRISIYSWFLLNIVNSGERTPQLTAELVDFVASRIIDFLQQQNLTDCRPILYQI